MVICKHGCHTGKIYSAFYEQVIYDWQEDTHKILLNHAYIPVHCSLLSNIDEWAEDVIIKGAKEIDTKHLVEHSERFERNGQVDEVVFIIEPYRAPA